MDRLFHSRIRFGSLVLLVAVLVVTVHSMWVVRNGILIFLMLLFMVVVIERMIHTTYTITADGKLVVHTGRFSKDKVIELSDIKHVEMVESFRIMGKPMRSFIVIECDNGKIISLTPNCCSDFLKCVNKRLSK